MSSNDPIIMYFIVRSSLEMGPGKIAAQCAHGAQMMTFRFFTEHENSLKRQLFLDWLDEDYRKVILKAKDSTFESIKKDLECIVVKDNGLTEVEPGSETVIVLYPVRKSHQPKLLKRLRLL